MGGEQGKGTWIWSKVFDKHLWKFIAEVQNTSYQSYFSRISSCQRGGFKPNETSAQEWKISQTTIPGWDHQPWAPSYTDCARNLGEGDALQLHCLPESLGAQLPFADPFLMPSDVAWAAEMRQLSRAKPHLQSPGVVTADFWQSPRHFARKSLLICSKG